MKKIRFWLIFGFKHDQESVDKKLAEFLQTCERCPEKGNNLGYLQASYKLTQARRAAESQGYKVNRT